ncbi:MAG: hypothetical protein NTX22_15980 [Ignavibacteriales bacterium]|nr:hypothetical protein [Ignavibacteriales bacterium]
MKLKILLPIILAIIIFSFCIAQEKYDVFSFEQELTLPGTPEIIYDAITGDISGWWDHSFSEKPYKLYIDAKPGGGFYEIYNESGDGVLHATVIVADRGKMLRFDGPLGLSGKAVQLVTTYFFEPVGKDSTKLKLEVHASGEVEEGTSAIVEKVWHHFLFERFKPYIIEKKYLIKK